MGTRGCVGFYKDGKEKIGYNHFDSYPTGLGAEIILYLQDKSINQLNEIFDETVVVENESNDVFDWSEHCIKKEFEEYSDFLANSLFCEYAYIINLDDNVLEFYTGFNQNPDGKGRYAHLIYDSFDTRYYGVVLKKTIPLKKFFDGKVVADDKIGFKTKK